MNATKEAGEPAHAGNPGGASVWYRWTAPASGDRSLDTCTGGFDTLLAVYTGESVEGLVPVASNDEGCVGGNRSALRFPATAGVTYLIAVDGFSPSPSGQGSFTLVLDVADVVANDAFADAQELTGPLPIAVTASNSQATKEPGEPDHAGNAGGASVWYRWTPTSSVHVDIDTCAGAATDALLAVYTGDTIDALTPVASNDDACGFRSLVELDVTAGVTYHIAVDGYGGTQGSFTLTVSDGSGRPANDDFEDATELDGPLPITVHGTTDGATSEPGEPAHSPFGSGRRSVWYRWTADVTAPVAIDLCEGAEFANLVAVHTGTGLTDLTLVESDGGECGFWSRLTLDAVAGTTYHVVVDGFGFVPDDTGNYTMRIRTGPPANDNLASAEELAGPLPITATGSTMDATRESREPDPLDGSIGSNGASTIWYAWTPTTSGPVTIETCSSRSNTTLGVHRGTTYDGLTLLGRNFDGCGLQSKLTLNVVVGEPLRIVVSTGDQRVPDDVVLTIRPPGAPPANDHLDAATPLAGRLPIDAYGSNVDSTAEPGEPAHAGRPADASVWYRWTADRDGEVVAETCGSQLDTMLAVYTGTSVEALSEVTSGGHTCYVQSRVRFQAAAGTTYVIAVDGGSGDEGAFRLTLRTPDTPANDDFADAEVLDGSLPISARGSNADATAEPGEPPDYAFFLGGIGSSVWYRWTASTTGEVAIDTCGSDHRPLTGVWTGSAVSSLSRLPAEDIAGCAGGSSIRFVAQQGMTYHIAIDGAWSILDEQSDNEVGDFRLTIRTPQPPSNDAFAAARELTGRLPIGARGTTVDATIEPLDPMAPNDASVWYRWTATEAGPMVVDACGSTFSTVVWVFVGDAPQELLPVTEGSSDCESIWQTRTRFTAVPGTTYRIGVAGVGGAQGDLQLSLRRSDPPVNDDFAAARALPDRFPTSVTTDNVDATIEPWEPTFGDEGYYGASTASIWFVWTAPETAEVIAETCGSRTNTAIAVYTGSSPETRTPVTSNEDRCGAQGKARFVAQAGTTYRIVVAADSAQQGEIRLTIRPPDPPDNDDVADAAELRSPSTVTTSNLDATAEPGEPAHGGGAGASLWYRWTPRASVEVAIDTCGSDISTALAVYTGDSVDQLVRVASSGDQACGGQSMVVFRATAGTPYLIAVDGVASTVWSSGVEGPIRLRFTCATGPCR